MALDFKVFVVRVAEVGKGYISDTGEDTSGNLYVSYSSDPMEAKVMHKQEADRLSEKIPGSVVKVRIIHEETI